MNKHRAERHEDTDEYLQTLTALYQQNQAPSFPTHIDSTIRAAAKTASKPKRTRSISRWMPSLALAATLLLAIGLINVVQQELPQSVATQPALETVGERLDLREAPADAPAKEESRLQYHQPLAPATPAPAASSETPQRQQDPLFQNRSNKPSADGTADSIAPSLGTSLNERESDLDSNLAKKQKAVDFADNKDDQLRTPKAWVEHIRQLRQRGDTLTAAAELKALQQRYPDYPLPADLRE